MKKIIALFMCSVLMASSAQAANTTKRIGYVYNTDIVAYINNYAIPSYALNGTSVVVAEDLRNFGFDVIWDEAAHTLSLWRNSDIFPSGMEVVKSGAPGSVFTDILTTDICVYAGGQKIPSYAINGYTMIPLESLTMFGDCAWVPEQRAVKLWVEGLNVRNEMQPVVYYVNTDKVLEQALIRNGLTNYLYYYPDDYDGDGRKEAFVVMGYHYDECWDSVSGIYFISSTGECFLAVGETGGSPSDVILQMGKHKFFQWIQHGCGSGSVGILLGCSGGRAYEPIVSRDYNYVFKKENGRFYGEGNDFSMGYHRYPQTPLVCNDKTGEFYVDYSAPVEYDY